MRIEWLGHACFKVVSESGLVIITDPYQAGFRDIISYAPVDAAADIVTVSHEHGDHNHVAAVSGGPAVVRGAGRHRTGGIEFTGLGVFHDAVSGAERGPNTIFTFEVDGIRLTHLGDLGHPLSGGQLAGLAGTDVLLAPTGGPRATLELADVISLWETLQPRIVIPMHFRNDRCSFPQYGADDLMVRVPMAARAGSTEMRLDRETLPARTEVVLLDPAR